MFFCVRLLIPNWALIQIGISTLILLPNREEVHNLNAHYFIGDVSNSDWLGFLFHVDELVKEYQFVRDKLGFLHLDERDGQILIY